MSDPDNTVARVVARLRERGPTTSVRGDASRVLALVEPAARRACRLVVPRASAEQHEDLVQQTLEIAWRRMPDLDEHRVDGAGFEAWVRDIARKVCANEVRRRTEVLTEDGMLDADDPARSVLADLALEERDQLVISAIEAVLTGLEQDVVYHRYAHGLGRREIARLLGLPDDNQVRVILQRARRRLRPELVRRIEALERGISFVRESH